MTKTSKPTETPTGHPETLGVTVANLTLEEKSSLTSGVDFWHTEPIERLGVPSIMMTDGPHGLRKQQGEADEMGMGVSEPATCFPPACGLGSSWDVELIEEVGHALGAEASIAGVSVVLGPGLNNKRSPLCGRNFEYLSEDPVVSGQLAAAYVRGIQSQGVGACVKHFAANNQETDRMAVSSDIDARTLQEIYLRGFCTAVRDATPWMVMAAYNKINGVYATESHWLLTETLRGHWGFDGVVVSDWGAVKNPVAALKAGLDLQMPTTHGSSDAQLVQAVRDGKLDASVVDEAASRVLALVEKAQKGSGQVPGPLDVDAHHQLARKAAARSIVLLKNQGNLLPLERNSTIAVIGEFAQKPRYQGAGSSLVNPTKLDSALEEITALSTGKVTYAQGFIAEEGATVEDQARLLAQAQEAAAGADVAVVFLGVPAAMESEGFDRTNIDLPSHQLEVLDAVLQANPNTVVVLSNGGVVALPFAKNVPAILEGWLLGQAGGGGTADVLFGIVNPSGKLAETIPLRLDDNPTHPGFPGEFGQSHYGEGLYVGYRWYDARDMEVAFPFGHGLSYTKFDYKDLAVAVREDGAVEVEVTVVNQGERAGREVVQVYTSLPGGKVKRPVRELKAFASVALEPGEGETVQLVIPREDLAYWNIAADAWVVEGGDYLVEVAASSRDIRGAMSVTVQGDPVRVPLSLESSLADVLANPIVGPKVQQMLVQLTAMMGDDMDLGDGGAIMLQLPLGSLPSMGAPIPMDFIEDLIAQGNEGLPD